MEGIFRAWGLILRGYTPNLSIEITRECPLRCPGCYAYGADHLGGDLGLRDLADYRGDELVERVMALVREHRSLHLSIVGGEPLVRFRELSVLLPKLAAQGTYTQLVTSAVRPLPREWAQLRRLQIVVSIDGLQPEHDERRKPATYDRILKHIDGHSVTVHCTITRQQSLRPGYLEEFTRLWSGNPNVENIWFSLYTPQIGEEADEILRPQDRQRVLAELEVLRERYPKLFLPKSVLRGYVQPPESPRECIFARTTTCVSADLTRRIMPCQFGGNPDCAQCGCIASAGLAAVGRYNLVGGLTAGAVFDASERIGSTVRRLRRGPARHVERPVPAPALRADEARR